MVLDIAPWAVAASVGFLSLAIIVAFAAMADIIDSLTRKRTYL